MRLTVVCCTALLAAAVAGADSSVDLRFVRDGTEVRRLDLATLRAECGPRTVAIDDPYYEERKSFFACPLADVLTKGFGEPATALRGRDVVFRARDGYEKAVSGDRLAEEGGWVAFADAARTPRADADPAWEPMGRQHLDPGPFYVVWEKPEQRDSHVYPWPYQLVAVEVMDLARTHPHIVPTTAPDGAPAWEGFRIFRTECVACHAVNGEGGTVGPDLNIPQSVVEYRPIDQLKAYIRDPSAFRYGKMPSHEDLTPAQLDALIAYFEVMKTLKHDPRRDAGTTGK